MSEPAYAIVVLGAAVVGGRPTPILRARLEAARVAFHGARAPRLIVTGRGEAGAMRAYLLEHGVPDEAIVLEPRARTTRENARFVAALVPAGVRLLLCTQPSHQPRACGLFSTAGLLVEPLLADESWSLYRAARERIAYAHHRYRGWIK